MKKKIRDLTLNEMREICIKNSCSTCPLHKYQCGVLNMWLNAKDDEIEVKVKE